MWGMAGAASAEQPANMQEFGSAKPPVGFVRFCASNPEDCRAKDRTIFKSRTSMTPDMWEALNKVNSYVNARIRPVSDQDLYGEVERWVYPVNAGDCEDFVLLKKRYLEGLGFSPSALLITVVLDEKGEGHAILTVATTDGDFLLDNRRDQILRWSDSSYTFLKRQSARDPLQWTSLSRRSSSAAPVVSTRSEEQR
jgi:predicted transglutaminase-like cysteine proteinase